MEPSAGDAVAEKRKKDSKKEKLFSAAMRLIGERGYGDTSVEDIAAIAKVSKGVVYYYFNSKADLAEQIISTGLESLAVRLDRAVSDDMDVEQALHALAREQMKQVRKNKEFAKFLLSEMWREDRSWRETLDRCIGDVVAIFEAQIVRGQDGGLFKKEIDAAFIAQTVFATFLAGALNWTVVHPEQDPDELADKLAEFALAGLRALPTVN